jgi:predicted kinase
MAKLTALIGTARSGKSTFSRGWEEEKDPDGLTRLVLNCDQVRLALHGHRWIGKAEPMVSATYGVMINTLLLNPKLHILLDDTHTTVASVRSVLNLDPDAKFIYIPCPVEVARKRAIDTNQSDLIPVIDRMYNNLQNLAGYHYENRGIKFEFGETDILKSVEKIRAEVRRIKEYSDRSV